jgi:signal recognition particle subunit SRP54
MGPLGGLMGMMPGMPKELKNAKIGDDELKPVEAIIRSMTVAERRQPEIINGSRRQRIAMGSGRSIAEVNRLVKQFGEMQKMMKRMGGMTTGKKGKRKMSSMAGLSGTAPGVPGFGEAPGGDGGFTGFPPAR